MSDQVTEVLRKAREVIEERGWCQGMLTADNGNVCAMGALRQATHDIPLTVKEACKLEEEAVKRMSKAAGTHFYEGESAEGAPYVYHVFDHEIPSWNDKPSRTVEDVLLMFKRAAEEGDE
jgi:hypothetical protein